MKFATKAIHAGNEPDRATGAVMPPIYMTSTFVQDSPGESRMGYEYTRAGNPNFTFLEKQIAALEDAEYGTVFSSGMGALTALVSTLSQGDKVVALDGVYGGTYRLFRQVFNRFGIEFQSLKLNSKEDFKKIEEAVASKPKWLFFETPTNPLMEIYDIEALSQLAKRYNVTTVVDNTFATPYSQNPLRWGIDIVWHSSTKYLGGHSDVIGGVVITNDISIKNGVDFARKSLGVNPSPFDAWLISRGIKTLAARMNLHQQNALLIAKYFEKHSKTRKVYYPGIESHPGHEIAKKQMRGYGGVVSVEFDLSLDLIKKLISSYKIFSLAESLGGVESLVSHPASMTHASIPAEERVRQGITDFLVRYSVGIEDASDLIEDLENAFSII
jgi:cystathionine beta-lyase/cystathionine gamma-synthase